jgi:hypothetical protein
MVKETYNQPKITLIIYILHFAGKKALGLNLCDSWKGPFVKMQQYPQKTFFVFDTTVYNVHTSISYLK